MGIKLNEIDAIIFDLGGVILNLDYDRTINAFKELGGSRFDELYTQANQTHIIDEYEVGRASSDQFVDFMLNFLGHHYDRKDVINAWNAMLLDLPAKRLDLLSKIGAQKRIFLFSNTNEIHYNELMSRFKNDFGRSDILEGLFEKAYFSHIVGKRKPNAEAFELVIEENGLSAGKTLFIDDSIQHIHGASDVGLLTYHLQGEDITDIFTFD